VVDDVLTIGITGDLSCKVSYTAVRGETTTTEAIGLALAAAGCPSIVGTSTLNATYLQAKDTPGRLKFSASVTHKGGAPRRSHSPKGRQRPSKR
jgi:hypothetical protein